MPCPVAHAATRATCLSRLLVYRRDPGVHGGDPGITRAGSLPNEHQAADPASRDGQRARSEPAARGRIRDALPLSPLLQVHVTIMANC